MSGMSGMSRGRLAILAVALIAAPVAAFGRDAIPWVGVAIAVALAARMAYVYWLAHGSPARVAELQHKWLELPGARPIRRSAIHVHDGMQPLTVRLGLVGGADAAVVQTAAGDSPVAFRAWPERAPPPSLAAEGFGPGGPPVERAPLLERLFAGTIRVEVSDDRDAFRLIGGEVAAALAVVAQEAAESFAGLTYDGRVVGVHWRGAVAAQPQRAAQLSRAIWRRFGELGGV